MKKLSFLLSLLFIIMCIFIGCNEIMKTNEDECTCDACVQQANEVEFESAEDAIFQQHVALEEENIENVFLSIPNEIIRGIFKVKAPPLSKKEIVSEYLENERIYSKLLTSEPSTASMQIKEAPPLPETPEIDIDDSIINVKNKDKDE